MVVSKIVVLGSSAGSVSGVVDVISVVGIVFVVDVVVLLVIGVPPSDDEVEIKASTEVGTVILLVTGAPPSDDEAEIGISTKTELVTAPNNFGFFIAKASQSNLTSNGAGLFKIIVNPLAETLVTRYRTSPVNIASAWDWVVVAS